MPPAIVTEMRNRPSTKEWLDKAYSAEKGATRSKAPGWLAMISPESVLRENFEKRYIARIGEEDFLDMAAMQWGIPTEHARRKSKKKLFRAAQNT